MNTVQTDDAPRAIGPYSQAVQVDGWLYASGQLPMTPAGDMVEGDIEAQTEQVFNNIEATLKAAGGSLSQVVKATVFVQDLILLANHLRQIEAEQPGKLLPA